MYSRATYSLGNEEVPLNSKYFIIRNIVFSWQKHTYGLFILTKYVYIPKKN